MNRWPRRFIYFLLFLTWLLVMLFPVTAVILAVRGQIQLGQDPRSHLRIFLLNEREASGVGIEWTRRVNEPDNCSESSLLYLLWAGDGENVSYCTCYDSSGAMIASEPGSCAAARP